MKLYKIALISTILIIGLYLILLFFLNEKNLEANEFGDYIGGILNPLFTLLSTMAIIILSYVIFKGESRKVDESIQIQKRLTLNQMRHEALNSLCDKLNLFIYEADKYEAIESGKSKFFKMLYVQQLEEKNQLKNDSNLWLIILFETQAFSNKKYLFEKLFETDEYKNKYQNIIESINSLHNEQNKDKLISIDTLTNYIETQQEFVGVIGNFILEEY